ncbi:apoptosis-stimulating of p53 protein 2 isoform X5 [Macrobrachium rosenbergii]|uniref:apoptosis-stimulating of p53 protein 2 isoform X5 n=1 Tax=Macrobrachium rosenbergii TaxID=79674 RepID=UPI0034D6E598
MQEGICEILFPVDADQEHYLSVMTNRWRWRTPSPGQDSQQNARSSLSTPTGELEPPASPPPLLGRTSPARCRFSLCQESGSAYLVSSPSREAAPLPPEDIMEGAAVTSCGLVVGPGEGAELGDDGQEVEEEEEARDHRFDQSTTPSWRPTKDAFDIDVEVEPLPKDENDPDPTKEEAESKRRRDRDIGIPLVVGLVKEANLDIARKPSAGADEGTASVPEEGAVEGDEGGKDVGGVGCVVVSLDSSRAASLTRTCRWAGYKKLPDGCELTVGELRDMASRQQQQIETQQQLLVAREQRLKYLKQQESRAAAVAAEADRLRRLRERVEAQEAKLRRLRALRGQVEATRLNTASLTTDLDAMRHLFSEKEKELVLAVSKVEELTRQLEELRQGRSPLNPNNQHHNELDKLRRELLYRNSVNREASARVDAQRETLAARRDEITRIDKRIAELQQRLHRKRILNHQLASQITAATQAKQAQLKAVQQKALRDGIHSENSADDINTPDHLKVPPSEDLGEFGPNKNDPKYQTLPYNTKFSVTFKTKNGQGGGESDSAPTTPTGIAPVIATPDATTSATTAPIITSTTVPVSSAVVTRTVHSIPTHPPSRGHAHAPGALNQSQPLQISQQPSGPVKPPPNPAMTPRVYGPVAQQFNQRTQPLGSSTGPNQKLNPGLTSLAQTRSLLPVHQSQEAENVKGIGINTVGEGNEDNASGAENGRVKPALPPKPAVPSKPLPPPRQKGDHLAASNESLNSAPPANRVGSQGRSQHGFRYASQNVIMSTYTQQTGTDPQSAEGSDDGAINKVANNIHNSVSNSKTESDTGEKIHVSINRRIEMPPDFMFPEDETPPSDLLGQKVEEIENGTSDTQATQQENGMDTIDHITMQPSLPVTELEKLRINHSKEDKMSQEESTLANNGVHIPKDDSRKPDGADTNSVTIEEGRPENEGDHSNLSTSDIINNINDNINNNNSNNGGVIVRRIKKGNLKTKNSSRVPRRVSFDPLALLLDASLEGELELVRRTAMEVPNPSAANDEGITALHNAICAGHLDIVTFLVTFGCDVNAQDSDGWTPLHCAASCNNVAMVRFLVEHGACILATTLSDHETAAEKCEQDEEGYDGCSQYLYSVQEKLGIMNGGVVYGVYDYDSQASDELSFRCGDAITILRRGDEYEREWWWGQLQDIQGYVPRNLLGLYPRVKNPLRDS